MPTVVTVETFLQFIVNYKRALYVLAQLPACSPISLKLLFYLNLTYYHCMLGING